MSINQIRLVQSEATNKNHLLATKDDFHSLKDDMHTLRNDMYKAMFLTGIVQLIAILGGTLAIVKLIK